MPGTEPAQVTECWFRNPHSYIKELVETRTGNIVWDRGSLYLKKIEPSRHAELYYPKDIDYRILVVGNESQGCAELDRAHTLDKPKAVYPIWDYGDEFEILEEMCQSPPGLDPELCADDGIPVGERPVLGQESRIIIQRFPIVNGGPGRQFIRQLAELQQDYPDTILHLHGSYSFRVAFGVGIRSADIDPRTAAAAGKIIIPPGREVLQEKAGNLQQWIHLIGFRMSDLPVPRNRCMYNIESAKWAAANWNSHLRFKTKFVATGKLSIGPGEPVTMAVPEESLSVFSRSFAARPGDKFQCDTCSLQTTCKQFRTGAVCSLPGAEPVDLAQYFKTRDSDRIIDGLGTVMAANTRRLERGMYDEDMLGELDPEVTKIIGQLMTHGVKLAKLVNPALNKPMIGVHIGQGAAGVSQLNPKQLVAAVVAELEGRGIQRQDITPDMIAQLLTEKAAPEPIRVQPPMNEIEGSVVRDEVAS